MKEWNMNIQSQAFTPSYIAVFDPVGKPNSESGNLTER